MDGFKPAPWYLSGKGYILIYKLSKEFVEKKAFVQDFLYNKRAGGFGYIMIVDYRSSNVGPYGELLFIPGKFKYNGNKLYSITKIYVSTMESVVNGKNNWGIPKEIADFKFEPIDDITERIVVSKKSRIIADFEISSGKISFPVNTKIFPFPLIQQHDNKNYYTSFSGKGKGKFAKVKRIKIDQEMFPDVSQERLIGAVKVEPFNIVFPIAKVETI